jgi:hypothetical protein
MEWLTREYEYCTLLYSLSRQRANVLMSRESYFEHGVLVTYCDIFNLRLPFSYELDVAS